jgi:hypothetical protein
MAFMVIPDRRKCIRALIVIGNKLVWESDPITATAICFGVRFGSLAGYKVLDVLENMYALFHGG